MHVGPRAPGKAECRSPIAVLPNANEHWPPEQAAACSDNHDVHRSAVRSAVAGDKPEILNTRWHGENPRRSHGFPRLQEHVEGHGGGTGIGRITMPMIVDEIDPRSLRPLCYTTGAAEYPEVNVIIHIGSCGRTVHTFNSNAPIVKAPRIANANLPLRFRKIDCDPHYEVSGKRNGENPEDSQGLRTSPSNDGHHDSDQHHDCSQEYGDEQQIEKAHGRRGYSKYFAL